MACVHALKRMGTHTDGDCDLLEKNKGKQEERIKKRKAEREAKDKDATLPRGIRNRNE